MSTLHEIELRSVLKISTILISLLAIALYLSYQARFLIIGPILTLSTETSPIYNERIIHISGTADNVSHITLNGRPVFTDESGTFNEPLVLENGYTIMTLRAEDRYGRARTLTRSFVYRPASSINL